MNLETSKRREGDEDQTSGPSLFSENPGALRESLYDYLVLLLLLNLKNYRGHSTFPHWTSVDPVGSQRHGSSWTRVSDSSTFPLKSVGFVDLRSRRPPTVPVLLGNKGKRV